MLNNKSRDPLPNMVINLIRENKYLALNGARHLVNYIMQFVAQSYVIGLRMMYLHKVLSIFLISMVIISQSKK